MLTDLRLKRALLVPSAVFGSPEDVVDSDELSLRQKLDILRRWEFDARAMQGAEEDAATGQPAMLDLVRTALNELNDAERVHPRIVRSVGSA